MSDASQEKDDPSIEEILASIRQIISDDDDESKDKEEDSVEEKPAAVSVDERESQEDIDALFDEEPEAEIDEDDEILELTEKVEDDGSITDLVEETEEEEVIEDEPEEIEDPEPEPEAKEEKIEVDLAEHKNEELVEPAADVDLDTEILTQSAAAATLAGFTKLARDIQVNRSFNNVTLEDIIRDQLEPLLQIWLDKHLPGMIEEMVQKELDKIAKKAMGE